MSAGALDGIRIVELADAHGEWCGKLLADMGAGVVKVEPPGGAATRDVGPFARDVKGRERSLYFWHNNTSKRGVTLDIEKAEGRDVLRRLIDGADVFIETLEPGRAEELGLSYATLSASNRRLVQVAITPFGQTGPYVEDGYQTTDLVTMALGGPMQSCGYDEEAGEGIPPVRPGPYHSYHTASHYACIGTLVALMEREASGRGQYIDVSAQAALAVTVEFASLYWEYHRLPMRRQTGRHAGARPTARTQYLCADGRYINLAIPLEEKAWLRLAGYLREQGLGEGLDDDAHRDPARRLERGGPVLSALEVLAARHTAEELFHIGQSIGMTWGAVRAPEEWLEDPHARARGFFVEVEQPQLGRAVAYPGAPYRFSGTPWAISRPAPHRGEHNREVYGEIGFSNEEIDRLSSSALI